MNVTLKHSLETILKNDIALDQFRIQTYELDQLTKAQIENDTFLNLPEVEKHTRAMLDIIDNAEAAGLMNPTLRFFHRSSAIEHVSEQRWLDGFYENELGSINSGLDSIREREGLDDDEYWSVGEGPDDYEELNREYSHVLDAKLEETLCEYGLLEMADLHKQNRSVYNARREEGRRIVFEDPSDLERLDSIQKQFEIEAEACAGCGAFHASAAMIGSAVEASLLKVCLKHRDIAMESRERLPPHKRPKRANMYKWGLMDLALVAEEAGWLQVFMVEDVEVLKTSSLISKIQRLRNLVHPGRHIAQKSALDVTVSYDVARASYVLLRHFMTRIQTP